MNKKKTKKIDLWTVLRSGGFRAESLLVQCRQHHDPPNVWEYKVVLVLWLTKMPCYTVRYQDPVFGIGEAVNELISY